MQLQVVAFNSSDNYSQPNETYFRIYDVDMHDSECKARDRSPSLEDQRKMKLGAGSLVCSTRNDEIDSNITGVVKSTHYNLVMHDYYSGTCRGTDARGYSTSCFRLVKMTSYSNGTKGSVTVNDITGWPDNISPRTDMTPCFYDDNRRSLALLASGSSSNAVIVRIDNLDYYYSSPTVTIVRTLEYPQVYPASSTLMNIDGNMGFISGSNLLAYSLGGDLVLNTSVGVLGSSSSYYSGMSFASLRVPVNDTRPAKAVHMKK